MCFTYLISILENISRSRDGEQCPGWTFTQLNDLQLRVFKGQQRVRIWKDVYLLQIVEQLKFLAGEKLISCIRSRERKQIHTLGNESNKNQLDILSIYLFYLFSEELVSLSSTEFCLQKGTGFYVGKFFKLFDPIDKKINSKI